MRLMCSADTWLRLAVRSQAAKPSVLAVGGCSTCPPLHLLHSQGAQDAPTPAPLLAGPASQYDEAGLLAADLASFVELRVVRPAPEHGARHVAAPTAPAANGSSAPAAPVPAVLPAATYGGGSNPAVATDGELGPSNYSQLGPPRPATGTVIAAEGGWASLYEQLRQRRSQLAQAEASHTTPPAAKGKAEGAAPKSAPPAAGGSGSSVQRGSAGLTPGATRPRAGVRRTALGPMLRILRDNQEL